MEVSDRYGTRLFCVISVATWVGVLILSPIAVMLNEGWMNELASLAYGLFMGIVSTAMAPIVLELWRSE